MSTDKGDDAGGEAGMEAGPLPENSMGAIISSIFNDAFQNIIHDMVLEAHREEKILRMRSAAMIAEDNAVQQLNSNGTPQKETATPVSASAAASGQLLGRVETDGAVYDNGRISLKGNPLQTTKDVICARCRLPQLQYPTSGEGARPPPDPSQKYCKLQPFVTLKGHDIWANPFPSDNAKNAKLKKEIKENAAKQAEQASANGSVDTPAGSPRPSQDLKVLKVTSYPYVKCNSCGRHIQVNRFAKHLDSCMGITGRQSSRNAIAKMSASQGTPNGSRTGTPLPGQKHSPSKRDADDDGGGGGKGGDSDSSDGSTVTPQKTKKKKASAIPTKPLPKSITLTSKQSSNKPKPSSKLKETTNTTATSSPASSPLKPDHNHNSKDSSSPAKLPKKSTSDSSPKPSAASGGQITLDPPQPRVLINKSITQPSSNGLTTPKKLKRLQEISKPSSSSNSGSSSLATPSASSSGKRDASPNGLTKSPASSTSSLVNGKLTGGAHSAGSVKKRKREEGEKERDRDKKLKGLSGDGK